MTHSSRSASLSSGSWTPPTPTRNAFQALSVDAPAPAAPVSWDFRRSSPGRSDDSVESVTGRICREIVEAQTMFGFRAISPVAMTQATPPGLEAVPGSCNSGSFRTWVFENDIIPDLEQSEADDELISEHSEDFMSNTKHLFSSPGSASITTATALPRSALSPIAQSRASWPCR